MLKCYLPRIQLGDENLLYMLCNSVLVLCKNLLLSFLQKPSVIHNLGKSIQLEEFRIRNDLFLLSS